MLGSSVLEVALGMALFFLLLAVICTSINEVIARMVALRARTLRSGLGELLGDPSFQKVAKRVYAHPLIESLEKKHRPSYIHARTFAAAMTDTIVVGAKTVEQIRDAIADDDARAPADQIYPDHLKRQLMIIINDAGDDMRALREGIGTWYDDAMNRVSGWYKRKTQVVTFLVALFLVLLLDADSLAIADGMVKNPAAREAFVAQASALAPTGDNGVPTTDVDKVLTALEPLGIQMGWSAVDPKDPAGWFANPANWLDHVPGWAITIFAVLLGAPFWFDLLNRVANIRSSGDPPQAKTALASEA
jgi:hypothetical protein